MGNKNAKLSPKAAKVAEEVFRMMDVDNSGTIDREETLKFWSVN